MAETFPPSLQDKFNTASFQLGFGNTLLRSKMDIGLEKVRNRYTKGVDTLTGTIDLTFEEYDTLKTFYKTTLGNGSKTFNYVHPIELVESEFRFVDPPGLTPLGGRYFRVSLNWEEIP